MPKGEGAGAKAEPRALAEPTRSHKTARKANQKPRQRKTETRRSEPSTITVSGFFHGTGKAKPTAPQGARASEKRGRLDRAGTVAIKAQSNNILRLFCDYSLRLKKQARSFNTSDLRFFWSGRRESNPRHQLGSVATFCTRLSTCENADALPAVFPSVASKTSMFYSSVNAILRLFCDQDCDQKGETWTPCYLRKRSPPIR